MKKQSVKYLNEKDTSDFLKKRLEEAVRLLQEVSNKFDEQYDLRDFDWRNLDRIREFLKENKS